MSYIKILAAPMTFTILIIIVMTMGCASDYKVISGDANPGADTGISIPPEDRPDVSVPEDKDTETKTEEDTETEVDKGLPVAVCSVSPNPVHPPVETATWDGSASYDASGYAITSYTWTLTSQPGGSAAIMPNGGAVIPNFQPDLAGQYVGTLVITNEMGLSDSCEAILESIPTENLWVEMYWTVEPDDMDLHLINTTAWNSALETNDDCYYANCTPSSWWGSVQWGDPGTQDDPNLDLDDIYGTGPENINIQQPQPWTYTVVVHDYTGSTSDTYGDNEVTVNVYINGLLQWSDTKIISGDGSYTPFCHIDWATFTVTSL